MPVRRAALPLACSILAACLLTRPACSQTQPPGFDDARARMADGVVLPLHHWLPSGEPQAVIVAVHGMNDHGTSFRKTGEYLAANGFAVYAFDQRGFGAAEQRGTWAGGTVMVDDARQVAQLLRMHYPGHCCRSYYGLGESMGGAGACCSRWRDTRPAGSMRRLSSHRPFGTGARCVGTNEAACGYWLTQRPGCVCRLASRGGVRSDDPETVRYLREDPLVMKKTRADALWGVADLMDAVTAEAAQFAVPLLVVCTERTPRSCRRPRLAPGSEAFTHSVRSSPSIQTAGIC